MKYETILDELHRKVTSNKYLQLFTAFTRILLAIGFIPPSIKKILGQPFTVLPDSNPVGHYFNALYQTGFYYEFLGWGQLTAAVLLLFPRTAHLGALAFFPIIINIAVLTNSVGFVGTKYITTLMALASTYLVAWDYDRLKLIFFGKREKNSVFFRMEILWLSLLFGFGGAFVASFFAWFGVANIHKNYFPVLAILSAAGLLFGAAVAAHHRFMPAGELKKSVEIT
ncbi:MAG TPA: hypothetical protein VF556_09670 [Pyrinomonadaceae bacterium]